MSTVRYYAITLKSSLFEMKNQIPTDCILFSIIFGSGLIWISCQMQVRLWKLYFRKRILLRVTGVLLTLGPRIDEILSGGYVAGMENRSGARASPWEIRVESPLGSRRQYDSTPGTWEQVYTSSSTYEKTDRESGITNIVTEMTFFVFIGHGGVRWRR